MKSKITIQAIGHKGDCVEAIGPVEKSLIGTMLVNQKNFPAILDAVKYEDFLTPHAQEAFSIIIGRWKNKREIDLVSIASNHPTLRMYLCESLNMGFISSCVEYSHQIAAYAKRRRLFNGIGKIFTEKRATAQTLDDLLALYQIEMSVGKKSPEMVAVMKRFETHISTNRKNGRMGFDTGFDFHRNIYASFVQGHVWMMGGFTSVGKTAVMIQKICHLLTLGQTPSIVVISTEMTEEQVTARIISNFTGIHSFTILSGNFRTAQEEEDVNKCKRSLESAKLLIYDSIYTLADIETALRKADLQGGVNVAFIDYVQNVRVPDAKSQYQEQSEIAKRIQQLAKDVRATIICLSQVSNDVGRGNTENLEYKGAGELAAVADYGIMLSRHKTNKHWLKYEVKKNRHGKLGKFVMEYKNEYTRLEETDEEC